MPYTNNNGQTRVGVRISPLVSQVTASTLWNSIYSVYNADWTASSSLKTSLYAVYNGELNTNDSYGSNNGTAIGGLTYSTGKIGNAFQFNGTNAYVSLPRTTNEFDFDGDFSISVWINPTTQGTANHIFQNYYETSPSNRFGFKLYIQNGRVRFGTYNITTNLANGSTVISNNTWYHVVITKTSGNAYKMYVNNTLQTLTLVLGDISNNASYNSLNQVNIGSTLDAGVRSLYFNGQIDSLNTWTRELSESEVVDLYNSGNGSQYISGDFYKPTTSDSLYLNNGTAVGGLTYVPGKVGTAFNFNGTDAYVNMGDVMDIGLSSWSYGMWFNVNNISSTRILFSKTLSGENTGRIRCSVTTGGLIRFAFAPTNTASTDDIDIQTTNTISLNTWYHVVFVLDRTNNMKIYLNGVLQSVTVSVAANNLIPYSGVNFNNINPFRIGSATGADNTSPTGLFSGQIDAFNVWNRVLTQSEITELYNSGNGVQYSNPLSPLLLDSYYGAAAAYSLRKLKNSWTGSAIKVRRSNDNVEGNIGFDASGNLDTASLLSFVGSNNISLYSEELNNVYWTNKNTTVTTNQVTAPDGTTTADLVSETTASDTHGISPNYVSTSFPAGTSWNISCYVKKGPGSNAPNTFGVGFQHGLGADTTVLFSFVTEGEIDRYSNPNDSNIGSSMVSVGNGWYRCSVWGTVAVTHSKVACGSFRFNNNSNIFSTNGYVGKTDANIYIWGWQFSKGLNNTSVLTTKPYIKTTDTAAGNGYVTTWYDQSGNGNDLTQATSANQARIVFGGVLDTLNNKPALVSNTNSAPASRYTVTFASAPISAASTFHIGSNAGSSSGFLWDGIVSSSRIYARSFNTSSIQIGRSSTLALSSYTQNITTQRIINAIYNNLSSKVSINNGSYTTGGTGALSGVTGLTLGAAYDFTQGAVAYYQEHIFYTSDQSINVAGINSNINSYYSIY